MRKIYFGLLLGLIAGVIDVIPMILQGITWDANLSAFAFWIIAGFMIATSNLQLKPVLKGIVVSFLVLIPVLVMVAWSEPFSLIPICIMALILGSSLGYFIDRFAN